MILVPAGSFEMGSPAAEAGRESQEAQHRVEITQPFYIGATEVTQAQWRAVMRSNPSWFAGCGPDCPVERVSWNDVQAFLAELQRSTGRPFRLPTEAEWEYSCRAGSTTPFHTGNGLSTDQANYDGEGPYAGAPPGSFRRSTTPVASFAPNAFGLHDMHGNVWEWTQDWHCPYPTASVRDQLGACRTPFKVIRGGSWYFDANSARCALRYTHRPRDSGFSIGFRIVMPADALPAGAQR
jgi:formylglycine-generating enzyme required for sulfatase activity